VKAFLDTSVLVAAAREADLRHQVSRTLMMQSDPQNACCAAHSLAELYSSLTGMRPPNRFRPEQAILVLDQVKAGLQCITLSAEEVFQTVRQIAALKLPGGIIYDALLMACARKVDAERIYTWNEKHFRMVAPDMADRITTP
jgi:predicted nucleic acid-binding protein